MKVYEILNEAISLSVEKRRIRQIIDYSIDKCMNTFYKWILQDIREGIVKDERSLFFKVDEYLEDDLQPTITKLLNATYYKEPYKAQIFFQDIRSDGQADGNIITVNKMYINKLGMALAGSVAKNYGDIVFYEDGRIDKKALLQVFSQYKEIKSVNAIINNIVPIIVHELVHVMQQRPQTRRRAEGKGTEYRSYLTKNQKEFNRAVYQLANTYDFKLYHASPQEIGAFAHNMAMELIDIATKGFDVKDYNDPKNIEVLDGMLFSIKETMKNREFQGNNTYEIKYKQFNQPQDKLHYKVFKRFMKRVYQEVQSYMEDLKSNIHKLKNQPEDWFMSEEI